jgi:GMP synthase PP-ATPase subunit
VTPEKVEIARQADHVSIHSQLELLTFGVPSADRVPQIFISEIRKAGIYDQISQGMSAGGA